MSKKTKRPTAKAKSADPNIVQSKKKPRYTVKTKTKDKPAKTKALLPVQIAPCSAVSSRLITYGGALASPERVERYEALCGAARPVMKAIASDCVAMDELKNAIAADIRKQFAGIPTRIGIHVARLGVFNGAAVDVSLDEVKKGGLLYKNAGVDGISTIRFCSVPQDDPAVTGIAIDLITLVWGDNADRLVFASTHRKRGPDFFSRAPMQWWEPDDPDGLDLALDMMFSPPFDGLPFLDPTNGELVRFDAQSDRGLRELLTLMCRSQVQISKMMVGYRSGKGIIKRALIRVDELMVRRCKSVREILTQEEIPHFWFAEVRRLELNHISVPIVKR